MYVIVAPIPEDLARAIERYRIRYDPLARAMPAHISLINPFELVTPFKEMLTHLNNTGEQHAPIKVSVAGWDTYKQIDYQLRLPIIAGKPELVHLREDLLSGPLAYCPGQDKDYSPHIMLGRFIQAIKLENAKQDLQGFEPQFIFRVAQLELLQWEQSAASWRVKGQFGLKATLAGQRK